ncbi:MAG TPA: type II secretion system F family protein [Phycisphaerales bacterium]|nr:type II secretion system F family protein [Phycisphaerales bacterium]
MKIGYSGFDKSGKPTRGFVDAPDAQEAVELLRRQGVFVAEVHAASQALAESEESGGGVQAQRSGLFGSGSRVEKVSSMARQLAILITTGTPVVDAIASIERQTPQGEWRDTVAGVRSKVEEGKSLAEAMAAYPRYFDAVCRSLVAAGETGGKLDVMLDRLARLLRQQVKVRKQITGAMVYPTLLMGVAGAVVVVMMTFVLPRFEGLFKSIGSDLPPLTKVLMACSHFMRDSWMWLVGGLCVVVTAGVVYFRSEAGRLAIDKAMVRLPQVGKVTRAFSMARIARVLGVLLDGKVPLLDALALTRSSMKNSLYQRLVGRAEDAVIRGETLSSALADPTLMSPAMVEAVRSGERSGQLAPVLTAIAEHMDEDNEVAMKTLTGLIEPAILLVLGLVVGSVAVGMMLPLFDLVASGTNGGGH